MVWETAGMSGRWGAVADGLLSLDSAWGWVAIAAVLLAGIVLVGWVLRLQRHFEIRVRGAEVHFRGRFPPECRSEVLGFFRNDLGGGVRARIIARRSAGGALRLQIDGALDGGEKQRIRNFLLMTLSRR